jgi:hypothetical protein
MHHACIMHGGNCIGEKMFMMLLLEKWSRCTRNSERICLVNTVENFINRRVFGTEDSQSQ